MDKEMDFSCSFVLKNLLFWLKNFNFDNFSTGIVILKILSGRKKN